MRPLFFVTDSTASARNPYVSGLIVGSLLLAAGCTTGVPDRAKPAGSAPIASIASAATSPAATSLPAASSSAAPSPAGGSASSSAADRPPSEGQRILVLGDSHLFGGLTAALKRALTREGRHQVWIYGSCGSSPLTWNRGVFSFCGAVEDVPGKPPVRTFAPSKTPHVQDILAEVKPTSTLLIMGSNFLSDAKGQSAAIEELSRHIEKAGSRCAWLGPPRLYLPNEIPDDARLERFYQQLGAALGARCTVIDSRRIGVKIRGTGDDTHVEPGSAAKWGEWAGAMFLGDKDPYPPLP